MQPFTVHTGTAVALRRSDVDTDQIIPSDWLKRVSRTGFADGLFEQWRADPGFVLNRPEHQGGTILLAGPDFGTGSSREHAVWALTDFGFRVVVSSRFGDIFRGNALKGGLLPVRLESAEVEALMQRSESDPAATVEVDLAGLQVRAGSHCYSFEIDAFTRWRLMEGLDDIGLTLRHDGDISAFEARRPTVLPSQKPLPAKA